jgi:hypothetical protein
MSEAIPKWHADNAEISGLLADLELQIEALTADLNKVRGTVARISYASLTAPSPPVPSTWQATAVEPAVSSGEPPPASLASAATTLPVWQQAPVFNPDAGVADMLPEPGFWDSVAEGASWPRSKPQEAPASTPEQDPSTREGDAEPDTPALERAIGDWMSAPFRAEGLTDAAGPSLAADEPPNAPPSQPAWERPGASTTWEGAWQTLQASDTAAVLPFETEESEAVEESTAWADDRRADASAQVEPEVAPEAAGLAGELQAGVAIDAPAPDSTPSTWVDTPEEIDAPAIQDETAATAEADAAEAATLDATAIDAPVDGASVGHPGEPGEQPSSGMPAALSFGWPDESVWSQNFEWPAMKSRTPASAPPPHSEANPERSEISSIVAKVRAEIDATRDLAAEPAQSDAYVAAPPASLGSSVGEPWRDDGATRDDTVELPGALESSAAEALNPGIDGEGAGAANVAWNVAAEPATPEPESLPDEATAVQDDATRRDEVSRAVEAIRRQMEDDGQGLEGTMANGEKPAFRLAAPGSIPDWSHVQLEPSGPPVVVLKDADGRVELASVFDTLNELGCGDGAALLNYTPHSVTVGLPSMAQVPSPGQMAEAVEKVFGLVSRVESDGVRITVNIGEDPKQRSGAA